MTDVVVLGWDALDIAVAEEYGVADAFGEHRQRIETYVNPVIDEPHTKECWPSLITGELPPEHGFVYADGSDGVDWDNDVLRRLSELTTGIVPHRIRYAIGRRLRDRGAELAWHSADEYASRGVATVFDDVAGRAISIPNYRTERDAALGLDGGRDELWAALNCDWDGEGATPGVDAGEMWDILGDALGRRLGLTLGAVEGTASLVFPWFGLLDSVGHIDPGVDQQLQRRGYEVAATVTETVRDATPADTTVLCISDHGLQNGSHTDYATVASHDAAPVEAIDSITDLRPWLAEACSPYRTKALETRDMAGVRDQLEELGYV